MGSRRVLELIITLFVVAVVFSGATAQSDCNNVLVSLSPCSDYLTGNSTTPSSECCNQLANVIKEQAICLCEVINGSIPTMGVNVNQTRALALPGACNVQTPFISQCNATSPSGAPNGPSGGSPGTSTPPGRNSSDGYRIKMSFTDDWLFSILVILASLVMISTVIV